MAKIGNEMGFSNREEDKVEGTVPRLPPRNGRGTGWF